MVFFATVLFQCGVGCSTSSLSPLANLYDITRKVFITDNALNHFIYWRGLIRYFRRGTWKCYCWACPELIFYKQYAVTFIALHFLSRNTVQVYPGTCKVALQPFNTCRIHCTHVINHGGLYDFFKRLRKTGGR